MAPKSSALDLQSVTCSAFHWAKCPPLALLDGLLAVGTLVWVPRGLAARFNFGGGEGVAPALRPQFLHTSSPRENFPIASQPMNDMHTQCPQCLLANSTDCREPDCSCLSGVPPKKEGGAACMDGASMKLLTTMGLRILALEDLIVRAAGLMPGAEEDSAFLDVLREARRILGKKKGAAV